MKPYQNQEKLLLCNTKSPVLKTSENIFLPVGLIRENVAIISFGGA